MRAFYDVLEQTRERVNHDSVEAALRMPAVAALLQNLDPIRIQSQRRIRQDLEREAMVEQRWEGYLSHIAEQGATYAKMGIPFRDWFELLNAQRAGIYEKVLAAREDKARLVLYGMDCFLDLTMSTLGQTYLETEERLVHKAESQLGLYIDMFQNASVCMMIYEWSAPPDLGSFRAIAANPAAIQMFTCPLDETLGVTIRESLPALLETDVLEHYAASVERGESTEWTFSQSGRSYDVKCFPLQGQYVGVMFENVTQRHRLTEAIERHGKELERSNRELDDFAYVASHDLKAPLRDIDNLASWIAEDAGDTLPADSKRHLALLQDRIARMERLLDDLLQYSRADRVKPPPEEFEVRAVIDEALRLVGPREGFEIVVTGDRPTIRTPRVPLAQLLRNLVSNAIKHHHRKQGRITIHVVEREALLEIAVTDDGPGIAPEFHERVFRMFQTLRPRDEVEGSGMGLAIVKKVVESHGGTVKIESAPGEGTTMRFTWPRVWPVPNRADQ
jgi:signal transduction histidine kinase